MMDPTLGPGLPPASRAGAKLLRPWLAILLIVIVCSVGLGFMISRRSSTPIVRTIPEQLDDELVLPKLERPGYVGPHACIPCHTDRVTEFFKTSHYRTCREPKPEEMPASFTHGPRTFSSREAGIRFEMSRSGNDFLQTAVHTTSSGEQRGTAKIGMVYGAGAADEVYLAWHGDLLYELAVAWLYPQKQWGASPFDRYGSGDFAREMTTRCLECHNTWMTHIPGTLNKYDRNDLILGVTCERCHGPGQEHVSFHQANPKAEPKAIVQPARLSRERQVDVCGQCHSNAIKRRGPAFSYRPGEAAEAFYRTNTSKYPEEDHVANQVKYLKLSKCFQKDDTLTCTTCHNPHRAVDHASSSQRTCLKCHEPESCGERPKLPGAVRDDCVGCHMPQHIKINVFFHTEDDEYVPPIRRHEHRIGIYPKAAQDVLLNWYRKQSDTQSKAEAARLTSGLVQAWLAEAEKCRGEYRFLAATGAIREALRVEDSPDLRTRLKKALSIQSKLDSDWAEAVHLVDLKQFPEAQEKLDQILAVKPNLAKAHGKLGTVLAVRGQNERAFDHLRKVAECDPDDPYGYAMIGWLAFLQGRYSEAALAFREADKIEPYNAKTNYHLGLTLAKLEQWGEAMEVLRLVTKIDPNHAGAFQGLGAVLSKQGQSIDAVRYALHAARLSRFQDADVLLTLTDAYAGAQRLDEAVSTANQALTLAQEHNPGMVPQIRWQLEQIRSKTARLPTR